MAVLKGRVKLLFPSPFRQNPRLLCIHVTGIHSIVSQRKNQSVNNKIPSRRRISLRNLERGWKPLFTIIRNTFLIQYRLQLHTHMHAYFKMAFAVYV